MKKVLFVVLYVACSLHLCFAKTITSFTADVICTTQIPNQEDVSISSRMSYCALPYEFIYNVTAPQKQYLFCTNAACYLYDSISNECSSVNEIYSFLTQTAADMLNWFKPDFGLSDSGYAISNSTTKDEFSLCTWKCTDKKTLGIDKIVTTCNQSGQFVKIQMLTTDDLLSTEIILDDYKYTNMISYPSTIISDFYSDSKIIMRTILNLSNVQFGTHDALPKAYAALAHDDTIFLPIKPVPFSKRTKPDTLSATETNSIQPNSIFGICIFGAYSFYKKFITRQDMSSCGYYPSCSQYMLQAVRKNGLFGVIQGYERLTRCNSVEHKRDIYPYTKDGKQFDPVP